MKAPPGSYQLNCLILDVREDRLRATCQTARGDWQTSELHDPDRCPGDISNKDGKLKCTRDSKIALPGASFDALEEGGLERFQRLARPKVANWHLEHDTWTFKDGAPENVHTLAQTADGFLWLGGYRGLYRFDGRRFELFHSPFGEELLSANISCLYAPPSGGLWIAYALGGISFLYKGHLKHYGDLVTSTGRIHLMAQDRDGVVWAVSLSSGLWKYEHLHWEQVGTDWNVPLKNASDIALDRDGNLWVVGERMLLCLPRGSRRFRIVENNVPFNARRFGTSEKLVDREGSVWFSSEKGLDRFFYSPLVKQEVPSQAVRFEVAADDDGKVLVGEFESTLYRLDPGTVENLPKRVDWEIVCIHRAPDGTIWLGTKTGLWHETISHRHPSKKPEEPQARFDVRMVLWQFTGRNWDFFALPSEVSGKGEFLQAIAQDRFGGMWLSLNRSGLYRLANGVWTSFVGRSDLPTSGVVCEFTDSLGRVWFGYRNNQVAVVEGDRFQLFGPDDGLRVGNITAIHGRGQKIWIGGEFGLEQLDAGHIKNISAVNDEWLRGITGIVETANGDLWLNGLMGIFHIRQSELAEALKNHSYHVQGDHFGRRDGLPGFATQFRPLPSATEASDGRIWFAVINGVVSVDPVSLEHRVSAPPIAIQSIAADDKPYDTTLPARLPHRTSSVQINFSAVSLLDPDAIRFRYKLLETDSNWHEVATANPVSYRNLSPGTYHLSVTSTDTNGMWSDKIATVEFTLLPAFYQTPWFRALCIVTTAGLLYGFYLLRMRQVAQRVRGRMEATLAERERIARDLHDTLLQSVQGLILKFQAIAERIPHLDPMRQNMEKALGYADQVVAEGRDRVRNLRSGAASVSDLPAAFQRVVDGMAPVNGRNFQTMVEGGVRELHPTVLEESYLVGREALINALAHSGGLNVEVEIAYGAKEFCMRIRDDGRGMAAGIVDKGGLDGHWGIQGMKERSSKIGADFTIRSRPSLGTEIELKVPAKTAYATTRVKAS